MTLIAHDMAREIDPGKALSVSLRECTATAHETAEQSPFMARLLAGDLDLAAAADYTGQLWFVYQALEDAVRAHAGQPRLVAFADPRLERLAAIETDLAELQGPDWRENLGAGPAAQRYVTRLAQLSGSGDVLGLIAHHYTRYLGDLSGGQVISRMLRQHYGITERGVNFYDFDSIGKIKPYRDGYRENLDALGLETADAAHLIAEANQAFALNGQLFRELAQRHCITV